MAKINLHQFIDNVDVIKKDIKTSLKNKGIDLSGVTFDEYSNKIDDLQTEDIYYKCINIEYSASGIIVSGAGNDSINGMYTLTSGTGINRRWTKTTDSQTYIHAVNESGPDEYTWYIFGNADTSGGSYYADVYCSQCGYAVDSNPWEVSKWYMNGSFGTDPVPSSVTTSQGEPISWSGNKLNITSGGITYDNIITSGLIGSVIINGIYNEDATKRIYENTLLASNIKKDILILGVTGTYEGGGETVIQPIPSISMNSSTGLITASYTPITGNVSDTSEKSSTTQLNTQSTQTIIPGTTTQIISAGIYLIGDQIISGDANLIASNIKKDTSIFNVTGTYEGEGSEEYYKCVSVIPASEGSIVVAAGSCSGTYTIVDDTKTGKQRQWTNGTYYIYCAGGTTWSIGELGDTPFYRSNEDVTSPVQVTTWSSISGSEPLPTLTQNPATSASWTGNKATISSKGYWTFAATATSGLALGFITPEVDGVYNAKLTHRCVDYLVLSGGLTFNSEETDLASYVGHFSLVDSTATGTNRVWKNDSTNAWIQRSTNGDSWCLTSSSEKPINPSVNTVIVYIADGSSGENEPRTGYWHDGKIESVVTYFVTIIMDD